MFIMIPSSLPSRDPPQPEISAYLAHCALWSQCLGRLSLLQLHQTRSFKFKTTHGTMASGIRRE